MILFQATAPTSVGTPPLCRDTDKANKQDNFAMASTHLILLFMAPTLNGKRD